MNLLVLLCSFFLGTLVTCHTSSGIKYVLTVSKAVISGSHTTACLLTQNAGYPLRLILGFNYTDTKDTFEITKEYACFQLNVPAFTGSMPGASYLTISLNEIYENSPLETSDSQILTVFDAEQPNYQLQMDKLKYRIGDLIMIRIFSSNQFTEPVNDKIKSVVIANGENTEVISWKEPKGTVGILHLEYQIKENDLIGTWSININNGEMNKEFQVNPPHNSTDIQIVLKYPIYIHRNDRRVTLKACAFYPNQKPITGNISFVVKTYIIYNKTKDSDPDYITLNDVNGQELKDGCAKKEVVLNIENSQILGNIEFNVTVEDSITKMVQNEYGLITSTRVPCQINFELLPPNGRINPGIPFVAKIRLVNRNINLDGETLQACYKILNPNYFDGDENVFAENSNPKYCVDIEVGKEDDYLFTIPPFKFNMRRKVMIGAKIVKHPAFINTLILQTTTGENSIRLLPIIPKNLEECNEKLNFIVSYTKNNLNYNITGINFMVTSRSETNKAEWIPTDKAIKQIYNPENYQNPILEKSNFTLETAEIYGVPFEIKTTDIKPNEHNIIAFYLPNDEMITDSYDLNILPCLKHKAEAAWEKVTVDTNEKVKLKILTTKNAICSISATEQFPEIHNYIPDVFQSPPTKCFEENLFNASTADTNTILKMGYVEILTNQIINTNCVEENKLSKRAKRHLQNEVSNPLTSDNGLDSTTFLWKLLPPAEDNIIYLEDTAPNKPGMWSTLVLCTSAEYKAMSGSQTVLKVI